MQNLITFQSLTMSSIEIAELVNKRHDNVKRTIETLAKSEIILNFLRLRKLRINNQIAQIALLKFLFLKENKVNVTALLLLLNFALNLRLAWLIVGKNWNRN